MTDNKKLSKPGVGGVPYPRHAHIYTENVDPPPLFLTMTLPKKCYKKNAKNQANAMINLLRNNVLYAFEHIYGAVELTKKGNIHCHCIAVPYLPLYTVNNSDEFARVFIGLNKGCLPMFDLQVIKDLHNVCQYMYKDIDITRQAIGRSAIFSMKKPSVASVLQDEVQKNELMANLKLDPEYSHDMDN